MNVGTVVTLFENIRAWWGLLCCKPLTNCLLRPTSVTYEINVIFVLFDPTETEINHQCGYCFRWRRGYRSCSLLTTCAVRFRSSYYTSNRILFRGSLLNGWQLGELLRGFRGPRLVGWLVGYLVFWAQSTTRDYIRAEGDFQKDM